VTLLLEPGSKSCTLEVETYVNLAQGAGSGERASLSTLHQADLCAAS